jgi:hypothetical protein
MDNSINNIEIAELVRGWLREKLSLSARGQLPMQGIKPHIVGEVILGLINKAQSEISEASAPNQTVTIPPGLSKLPGELTGSWVAVNACPNSGMDHALDNAWCSCEICKRGKPVQLGKYHAATQAYEIVGVEGKLLLPRSFTVLESQSTEAPTPEEAHELQGYF